MDPQKMTTVKKEETVKADVDRLLPAKYLGTSYHAPGSSFRDNHTAYNVSPLIV